MSKPHSRPYDDPDGCVVALFCDTGERYLSKPYDDARMEVNGFL